MVRGSHRRMVVPSSVYRLMSLTGANFDDALSCWRAARGDLLSAVHVYEERCLESTPSLEPPSSFQSLHREDSVATEELSLFHLSTLLSSGSSFVKGVLVAAAILVAVDAL